jgi:hypothetical protein
MEIRLDMNWIMFWFSAGFVGELIHQLGNQGNSEVLLLCKIHVSQQMIARSRRTNCSVTSGTTSNSACVLLY